MGFGEQLGGCVPGLRFGFSDDEVGAESEARTAAGEGEGVAGAGDEVGHCVLGLDPAEEDVGAFGGQLQGGVGGAAEIPLGGWRRGGWRDDGAVEADRLAVEVEGAS